MSRAKKQIVYADGCEEAPSPQHHAIYVLLDPREDTARYVGKARQPEKRLSAYTQTATPDHRPVSRWVHGLRLAGRVPTMGVVEWATDWQTAEQIWIAGLRADGHPLLNISPGGLDMQHARIGRRRWPVYRYLLQRFHSHGIKDAAYDLKIHATYTRKRYGPEAMDSLEATLLDIVREHLPMASVCR